MKQRSIGGIIFGILFIVLALGAFNSGEPASLTTEGRFITIAVFIVGVFMVIGNLSQSPQQHKIGEPVLPELEKGIFCRSCGSKLSPEFKVCPYCGEEVS